MIPLALLPLYSPPQTVDAPALEFYQDFFVVRRGQDTWREPLTPPEPTPALAVAYRKDQNYAVWDDRGLTVRRGDKVLSTKLPYVPTAPKLFERPDILETISQLESGKRTRDAAGLSGSIRIGADVYFLIRWENSEGKPWMEALCRVSLDGTSLKPEVLGRFQGLSVAYKPIDDRLIRIGSNPTIVARVGDTWGTAVYERIAGLFTFQPLGANLNSIWPVDRNDWLFVETSGYGTTIGGRIDLDTGLRRNLFESRANGRFVDSASPLLMVTSSGNASQLRNGDTGAETTIPNNSGVRRIGPFAVVFAPAKKPTRAQLYEVDQLAKVAQWSARSSP